MNMFLKGRVHLAPAADKVAAGSLHSKSPCTFIMVACCLTLFSIIGCTPASVSYKKIKGSNEITIDGQITHDTYIKLKELYDKYEDFKFVRINSNGGNVDAAIDIGFLFREKRECLTVLKEDKCNSACVFVLAGAPYRNVLGKVGIHRPYIDGNKQEAPPDQKSDYDYMMKKVKLFLEYMNIPLPLYDEMIKIHSNKIRYLSRDELVSYKLSVNDSYYEKDRADKYAKQIGITKTEYERRIRYIEDVCYKYLPDTARVAACYRNVRDTGKE
jgi:hypothetical protein